MEQEKQPAEKKEKPKKSLKREIFEWIMVFVVAAALAFVVRTFIFEPVRVDGSSMLNTLENNEFMIATKFDYLLGDPERFDIIVFPFRYKDNTYYIKRIIGLPGETVQIVDGEIYINGELLEESYGREVMQDAGLAAEPITLGDDEYFVLGDNRNDSMDSRMAEVGPIVGERIIGRAWLRIYPFDQIGFLKHGS